ncbi:MAG: LysR family transcriptional regulator [Caldimonas sp.]
MDIRSVDLNLLVVFDAMVEHRSVTRAAEAIGLSQPAMSAAVGRLRTLFGDPLFMRSGAEMQPTPRATALAAAVRRVIGTVKSEILQTPRFEPSSAERLFTIIAPDIAEIKLLPQVLDRFATQAPMARLRTLSMPRHAAGESLESGAAELAVGYFPDLHKAGFYQQQLFATSLICMVRRGHPTIGTRLTLKQYLAASHVLVRPEGREHVFDQFLQQHGLKRRVVLEVSHYMSLLPIIERSDLVATVPLDLAEVCVRHAAIRTVPTPIKSPPIKVHQFWHARFHKDPANVWLRGVLHSLFGR